MNYKCMLQGAGFILDFNLKHISKNYIDVIINFAIDTNIQPITVQSAPNYITVQELERLFIYFDEHMTHIETDSYVFVPLEVGFQLKAQMGDYGDDGTGYISLLVLLNIGFNKNNDHIYCGGVVTVTLTEMESFLRELRLVFDAVHQAQITMIDPEITHN